MSLPTLADLKDHLDITGANNDGELTDMLDAAVDVVEGIVGPVAVQTVTETHRGNSGALVLRSVPIVDVSSVSSFGTVLTLDAFDVDSDSGLVRRVDGYGFVGSFTVTYSVGRPLVPAAMRLAILIIAAHLWETQRGNTGGGPLAADVDAGFTPTAGYAIPNRARELLARYVQVSIA